jgi:hypothetical protein
MDRVKMSPNRLVPNLDMGKKKKRSVKETCTAICQRLDLTIRGFSTIEIVHYHRNVLSE